MNVKLCLHFCTLRLAATDTAWAPWYVIRSDDKRRTRLNCITHLLKQIPYEETPRQKIKLAKRQTPLDCREAKYAFRFVDEVFW